MFRKLPAEIGKSVRTPGIVLLAVAFARLLTTGGSANAGTVSTFAGNAQHTAIFPPAAQNLNAVRWQTPIDLNVSGAFAHYGAPLITEANTVLVPVKTAINGFQVNAFNGATGAAKYTLTTDYSLPSHNWIPTYNPALATHLDSASGLPVTRLYFAGSGGTVYRIDNPDANSPGSPVQEAFYGLANYQANAAAFNSSLFVNTPITADSTGNIFFGFRVQGTAPIPLNTSQSGFARIDPIGHGTYVLAGAAAGDGNIGLDSHNSAPALSNDGGTLYVTVKSASTSFYGYLLGLDATTLATKYKVLLKDPRNAHFNNAGILDDSTASPTVAPDGDVYLGIFGNPFNGSRGFLLRFSGDLGNEKTPGAFGWDYTPAIVPASMVPSYTGASSYLIFSKYNNYAIGDGDGVNQVALLDPNATQIDPHPTANGLVEMREVLTVSGPTPDPEYFSGTFPNARREWCINTAAVNPATQSIFIPSEDGHIYRWDLGANSLSQAVRLTPGIGEPYVPTVIGPDGTVFTLNGGTLFALGTTGGIEVSLASSKPDVRSAVVGQSLTFTATVTIGGSSASGAVTFQDVYFQEQGLASSPSVLAQNVLLVAGRAAYSSSALGAGVHFITATYVGAPANVTRIQKIHQHDTTTSLLASPNPSAIGQAVSCTATVTSPGGGIPTGMVTFQEGSASLAQVPLTAGSTASFSTSALGAGTHAITVVYASDSLCASSSGNVSVSVQAGQTTIAVASSANPVEFKQSVTFTATVTPVVAGAGTPMGTVTFGDGASTLASGISVDGSGRASFSTAVLAVGNHVITAAFSGASFWQNSSGSLTQGVRDTTPPAQPTGLNTTPGPNRKQITLKWNANPQADNVTGYEVWRASTQNGSYSQIATTTISYVDSLQNSGQVRWYYLVARDASGNRSLASVKVSGTPK